MVQYSSGGTKEMTRKTETSYEVKKRWIDKNYKRINISLRYDTDQHLIDFIEKHKDKLGMTNIFRDALELYVQQYEKESED